ncbi:MULTISPECIES: DUF2165 family protein [unclassified Pseudomonas]|jgi:predicted small integral membrane protein|uniref:DUF2165 family protein n=1 Tax=unclassified Pseudomonas TaxID=196821 RepID=UPI000702CD5E|nr:MULTISPECIES: DUF2165 family protein [unclassified Pseudomonas]KQZ82575.1 hypothetical protein ASD60_08855 [Pseudomonas sp. Root562]
MNNFTTTLVIRRSKLLVVLIAFLFGFTTSINNFTDYAAYTEYIGRIISMSDTTGNDSRLYRAVTHPLFHHRFYWAIITLEVIFTISFLVGAYQIYRKLAAPRSEFHEAKKFAIIGFSSAIFVYQVLYVIILNEWFDMESSVNRNAFYWARSNIEYMFFGLIYLLAVKDN